MMKIKVNDKNVILALNLFNRRVKSNLIPLRWFRNLYFRRDKTNFYKNKWSIYKNRKFHY